MSSILAFRREALPTLQYFPNDTELALGMTLLELHYILQIFCVRQEDGGGVNWGGSDIVKASFQIFLTLGLIKQSNALQSGLVLVIPIILDQNVRTTFVDFFIF